MRYSCFIGEAEARCNVRTCGTKNETATGPVKPYIGKELLHGGHGSGRWHECDRRCQVRRVLASTFAMEVSSEAMRSINSRTRRGCTLAGG